MALNISEVRYVVCWTEDDGIYWCGHKHPTIGDAMQCIIPDGRHFVRAWEKGIVRSLNDAEIIIFLGEQWRLRKVRA
jgi:hypothetical protein